MTYVTCRLTIKNRDQLRNPTVGNRVWATFTEERNDFMCLLDGYLLIYTYKSLSGDVTTLIKIKEAY